MIQYGSGAFGLRILLRVHGQLIFVKHTALPRFVAERLRHSIFAHRIPLNVSSVSIGSAVYKSFFPCLLTSIIYIALFKYVHLQGQGHALFLHPYPMAAIISALTFLLAFRANFSYNRYWESVSSVHQMHSKWLDVGMTLGTFHFYE
jgi:Bestrophin, RFP-TM, chloride channel